jgi:hypothetical protein
VDITKVGARIDERTSVSVFLQLAELMFALKRMILRAVEHGFYATFGHSFSDQTPFADRVALDSAP